VLTTRVVDRLEAADALAPEWRGLLARASYASAVRTPLWALSWWRVFGGVGGRRMRIVTVREGEVLIGLAPLLWRVVFHRRAVPLRRIEPIGTGEDEADEICSDYVGVVAARGRERDVANAVARAIASGALGGWDELVMPALPSDDAMVEEMTSSLAGEGVRAAIEVFGACPYVALPSSWDAYLKALAAEDRYLVTRSLRELEKWAGPGGFTLHVAQTASDLAEGRRVLHSLHGERWASRGHAGVFVSERFTRFHDLVMPKLLARDPARADGELALMWLTVQGRPVAAAYNIAYEGRVHFYQSGRALDVPRKVRPGIALHALAIRAAIEAGRREYDFLNGDAHYKTQLATATRGLVLLRARGPSPRARAAAAAVVGIERTVALARRLKALVKEERPHADASGSAPAPARDPGA
jgi:CelD/BcsL family acetyltransferase involved in cellulose biosynthesis